MAPQQSEGQERDARVESLDRVSYSATEEPLLGDDSLKVLASDMQHGKDRATKKGDSCCNRLSKAKWRKKATQFDKMEQVITDDQNLRVRNRELKSENEKLTLEKNRLASECQQLKSESTEQKEIIENLKKANNGPEKQVIQQNGIEPKTTTPGSARPVSTEEDSSDEGNKWAKRDETLKRRSVPQGVTKEEPSKRESSHGTKINTDVEPHPQMSGGTLAATDELERQKTQLEKVIKELNWKKTALQNDVTGFQVKEKKLKETITELEVKERECRKHISDLNEETRKVEQKLASLKKDVAESQQKEDKVSELKINVSELEKQRKSREEEPDSLRKEFEELKNQKSITDKKCEKLKSELKEPKKTAEEASKELQKELEAQKRKTEEAEKFSEELKEQKETAEEESKEFQKQLEAQKRKMEEAEKFSQELKEQKEKAAKESEGLKKELEEQKSDMKKKLHEQKITAEEEANRLQEGLERQKRKAEELGGLKEELKEEQKKYKKLDKKLKDRDQYNEDLKQQVDDLRKELDDLKTENAGLKARISEFEKIIQPTSEELMRIVVIPKNCRDDSRIQPVLKEWLSQLQGRGDIQVCYKDGKDIQWTDGIALLHCVVTGSAQRDIEGAIRVAGIGPSVDLIVVAWHHKAQHVSFPKPTQDNVACDDLVKRCLLISDAFFFQGKMYQCAQNETSVSAVHEVVQRHGQATVVQQSPQPANQSRLTLILPQSSHDDDRITPLWSQLLDRLKRNGVDPNVVVREGRSITNHDGIVVLPCIAASRVGSDLSAALDKAKLGPTVRLIIVIFNCKAPHESRIAVPTRDRMSDRETVNRCLLFADAVFWEKKMYECKANDVLMDEFKAVLSDN